MPTIEKKIVELEIEGWVSPLTIEYHVHAAISGPSELVWGIVGTTHRFRINLTVLYKHHRDNMPEHFQKVLSEFRKDYLMWWKQKWPEPWMKNYWEFSKFIKIDL